MPIMIDLQCGACDHEFESIIDRAQYTDGTIACPECNGETFRVYRGAPGVLTSIIPSYPGSKKNAAGHQHTHADRAASKIQSGFGGCQGPPPKA